MTFWQAYARFWTQAFNLKGRARRLEYWAPTLINGIIGIIFVLIYLIITGFKDSELTSPLFNILDLIFAIVFMIPNFSIFFRRMQDLNYSGWWSLVYQVASTVYLIISEIFLNSTFQVILSIIVIIVLIITFVLMCLRGTDGPNKYGPDPYEGVYSDRTY